MCLITSLDTRTKFWVGFLLFLHGDHSTPTPEPAALSYKTPATGRTAGSFACTDLCVHFRVGLVSAQNLQLRSQKAAGTGHMPTGLYHVPLEDGTRCAERPRNVLGCPSRGRSPGAGSQPCTTGPYLCVLMDFQDTLEAETTCQSPWCPHLKPMAGSCSRNTFGRWLEFLETPDLETGSSVIEKEVQDGRQFYSGPEKPSA